MTITYSFSNSHGDEVEYEYECEPSDYYEETGASLSDILGDYENSGADIPEREEGITDEQYLEVLYEDMHFSGDLGAYLEETLRERYKEKAYGEFLESSAYEDEEYPYCYY